MQTVTLPKTEYQTLKKKASLYEAVFKLVTIEIEKYSKDRIKQFKKEDRVDKQTRNKIKRILQSI